MIKSVDKKSLFCSLDIIIIFSFIIATILLYLDQPAMGTLSDPNYKILKQDDNTTTIFVEGNDRNPNTDEIFGIDVPTIISAATATGGIIAVIIGIITYRQTSQKNIAEIKMNRLKEIIFPLINEIDKPGNMDWAKQILEEKDLGQYDPAEDYPYGA